MVTKNTISIQRLIAILSFLIYDFVQIYVVGHLIVETNSSSIFRYQVRWSPELQFSGTVIVGLLVVPFVISYVMAVSSIGGSMVQIIGPDSLLRRMQLEFHKGNPEKRDFTEEEVELLLSEMSQGEPDGTIDNLRMLFELGVTTSTLIKESKVKSIKRVFVSDDLTPNAFTLRVIPLPFVGQDWIIINRNIVDILDPQEIKAVLAHEIGHAARKDSWLNALLFSPRLVIIFGWSIILGAMAGVIINNPFEIDSFLRIGTLLIVFAIVRYLMNAGQSLIVYAYRKTELLADYYAAKLVGMEELVNALVKIGSRGEVIQSISLELDKLDKLVNELPVEQMAMQIMTYIDPSETQSKNAKTYAVEFFVRAKLNQVFRGFQITISDEDFNRYVNEAKDNLTKAKTKDAKAMINKDTAMEVKDWRSEDLDLNQKLDLEEIKSLVEDLRENNRPIFESELLQMTGQLPQVKTHPQVSERIFFLYDNLMQN